MDFDIEARRKAYKKAFPDIETIENNKKIYHEKLAVEKQRITDHSNKKILRKYIRALHHLLANSN